MKNEKKNSFWGDAARVAAGIQMQKDFEKDPVKFIKNQLIAIGVVFLILVVLLVTSPLLK